MSKRLVATSYSLLLLLACVPVFVQAQATPVCANGYFWNGNSCIPNNPITRFIDSIITWVRGFLSSWQSTSTMTTTFQTSSPSKTTSSANCMIEPWLCSQTTVTSSFPSTISSTTLGAITIVGNVDRGVEAGCLVLYSNSGAQYTLMDIPTELSNLASTYIVKVMVTGVLRPDVASYCMQGQTLQVQSYQVLELIQRTQTQTVSTMLP